MKKISFIYLLHNLKSTFLLYHYTFGGWFCITWPPLVRADHLGLGLSAMTIWTKGLKHKDELAITCKDQSFLFLFLFTSLSSSKQSPNKSNLYQILKLHFA